MKTRLLIIDDEPSFLQMCSTAFALAGYECEVCSSAEQARRQFHHGFFDGIVCDILIPYQGVREGGINLAREFLQKHPTSCIVLTSQFFTAKWVNQFSGLPNHAFVEKGETIVEDLLQEVARIARTKLAFICMPFARAFQDFYEVAIKPVLLEHGYKCRRIDEVEHSNGTLELIYQGIHSANLVIADMTGKNPNVYYEVGYAHALGKEVVLLIQTVDDLPFDLRGFNHIVYEGRIVTLREKLSLRLKSLDLNRTDGSGS